MKQFILKSGKPNLPLGSPHKVHNPNQLFARLPLGTPWEISCPVSQHDEDIVQVPLDPPVCGGLWTTALGKCDKVKP